MSIIIIFATYMKKIYIVISEGCFSIVPIIILRSDDFSKILNNWSRGRIDFDANRNALTYQRCSCARVEVSRKVSSSAKAARDPFARTSGGTTSYRFIILSLAARKVGFSAVRNNARSSASIAPEVSLSRLFKSLLIRLNSWWNYSSRRDDSSAWPRGWWIGWCFRSLFWGLYERNMELGRPKILIRLHDTILGLLAAEERSVYRSEHTRCLQSGLSVTYSLYHR